MRIQPIGHPAYSLRFADGSGAPASIDDSGSGGDSGMGSNDVGDDTSAAPTDIGNALQSSQAPSASEMLGQNGPQTPLPTTSVASVYNDSNKSFITMGQCDCEMFGLPSDPMTDEDGIQTCQNCGECCNGESEFGSDLFDGEIPGFDSLEHNNQDPGYEEEDGLRSTPLSVDTQDDPGYNESELWNEGRDLVDQDFSGQDLDAHFGTSGDLYNKGYLDRINDEDFDEGLANLSDSYLDGYDAGSFYNETPQQSAPQHLQDLVENENSMVRNVAASKCFQCQASLKHNSSHTKCANCGLHLKCAEVGCELNNPRIDDDDSDFLGGESDVSDEEGYGVEDDGTDTDSFDASGYFI